MTERQGTVVVLASFVMDLVARAPYRPRAGESVVGTDFGMFVGGKGNNQALAAARSGAAVRVIGRLGDDLFAPPFVEALSRAGIDATWVSCDPSAGTGVALPLVEPNGQNSIVVIPRANQSVSERDVADAAAAFEHADVLLAQFEVPVATVGAAVTLAHARGAHVLLNPAPAPAPTDVLTRDWFRLVDLLIPNESEAELLTGIAITGLDAAEQAGRQLLDAGCRSVIVTLGDRGALWLPGPREAAVHVPPIAIQQIDATAAGDAFCGALAAGIARKLPMPAALRRAAAAGALAASRLGAEPSLPTAADIDALLAHSDDAPPP